MCDKFAQSIPVTILFGRSGFGDAIGCIEAATGDDTQEFTSLGGCSMWNNAAICSGRVWLKNNCEGLVLYVEIT